jgi:hypothetical protein
MSTEKCSQRRHRNLVRCTKVKANLPLHAHASALGGG